MLHNRIRTYIGLRTHIYFVCILYELFHCKCVSAIPMSLHFITSLHNKKALLAMHTYVYMNSVQLQVALNAACINKSIYYYCIPYW